MNGCTSPACQAQLGAASSLTQGQAFANMTKDFHGGTRRFRMRGGAADFPSSFDALLPADMHGAADIGRLDKAFAELPQFAGKYGMSGGRRSRRNRRARGGALAPADVTAPAMILGAGEERAAMLNPQWYTENQVVPSFKGPENAYAAQQYANQPSYAQKAGKRRSRKANRKNSRKNRKNSRKASRKNNRK